MDVCAISVNSDPLVFWCQAKWAKRRYVRFDGLRAMFCRLALLDVLILASGALFVV